MSNTANYRHNAIQSQSLNSIKSHGAKLDILIQQSDGTQINKIESTYTDRVKSTSLGGASMYTTESAPIVDTEERQGWLFNKTGAGGSAEKFNWFFYGAGNTLTKYSDLKSISCMISVDSYSSSLSLPFFIVYTKPTGVNDYSWYKSSITYSLSAGEIIHLGEQVQAWSGVKPVKRSNRRLVEFNITNVNTLGTYTGVNDEELYSISIHSDSTSGVGTKILVSQVGYDLYSGDNKIERRIDLIF
jgi:hypothetical protein